MSAVIFLILIFSAFAQEFQYRAEGSFQTRAAPNTTPTTSIVNYSIRWNETATTVQGLYQDNFFALTGQHVLTGTVQSTGRDMSVILPQTVNNVKAIKLQTGLIGQSNASVAVKVTTINTVGSIIDSPAPSAAQVSAMQAQTESNNSCVVGFGVLSGFCGIYNGTFTEMSDTDNRCDLTGTSSPRLELSPDTVFRIHVNYIPGAPTQSHTVGAFIPSPLASNINITGRYCGVLHGTTFVPGNCRTMYLTGDFRDQSTQKNFVGTYTITDDVNLESCSYMMSLNRELAL